MTITPEKLRSLADAQMGAAVVPAEARMLADAMEIADSCARSDIECYALHVDGWYDTTRVYSREHRPRDSVADKQAAEHDLLAVVVAYRYLDARGLIEHHPEHHEWVRLKEGA